MVGTVHFSMSNQICKDDDCLSYRMKWGLQMSSLPVVSRPRQTRSPKRQGPWLLPILLSPRRGQATLKGDKSAARWLCDRTCGTTTSQPGTQSAAPWGQSRSMPGSWFFFLFEGVCIAVCLRLPPWASVVFAVITAAELLVCWHYPRRQ